MADGVAADVQRAERPDVALVHPILSRMKLGRLNVLNVSQIQLVVLGLVNVSRDCVSMLQ